MRAVIIDNEPPIRQGLIQLLEAFCPEIEVVGEADGVQSGKKLVDEQHPDLVFLDVEMDDGTGMDLLTMVPEPTFQLIFCTAHDKYAIDAFRFSAIDFLLKPIDPEELMEAVKKASDAVGKLNLKEQIANMMAHFQPEIRDKKIVLKDAENLHVVRIDKVLYLEAQGSYTNFTLDNSEEILVSKNLKEYESLLGSGFFRTHHSYLVNVDKVLRYEKKDGGSLIMENGQTVPVSVRRKELLLARLEQI